MGTISGSTLRVELIPDCIEGSQDTFLPASREVHVVTKAAQTSCPKNPEILHYGTGTSELGIVLVASALKGVVAILIGGDLAEVVRDLEGHFPNSKLVSNQPGQEPLVREVMSYIRVPRKNLDLKLDLRGTAFQKKVWRAVQRIPIGETTTYTALAALIGHPKAFRAVGNACTVNPYAFAVPCHRVLHTNPALSFGHNRGNDRMRPMVAREQKTVSESTQREWQ
jgi:AraC family transcriptional regulator of adaptative response/methylated-DNA-[protein]-cysteine methyltransferase